jgi:carbonyl reductase 1
MNETGKVAVVTGGNRGIGLEIGKQLAARQIRVILGARDEAEGRAAAASLGHEAVARQLDVTRADSIEAFAAWLTDTHGGLDILVDNAGIAMEGFDAEVARRTLDVNYFGAARVTDRLLPLMRRGGRVVMVTSGLGDTTGLPAPLRARLHAPDLTREALDQLMESFVRGVAAGRHTEEGWPSSAYRVSKMGLNALTTLYARALAADDRGILVNAACPGWVRTRMGGAGAPRSVEEGADTPVWLALLPTTGPQGGVFRDRQPVSW